MKISPGVRSDDTRCSWFSLSLAAFSLTEKLISLYLLKKDLERDTSLRMTHILANITDFATSILPPLMLKPN